MSNLCYNCGDCHLPRPCPAPLKLCEICDNPGHAFNFCPLGVHNRDPKYTFWALCHNCDTWHLPNPCALELHHCNQCGSRGHREYFCAVSPLTRDATMELFNSEQAGETGVKRKRADDESKDSVKMEGTEVAKPTLEMIRSIKEIAVRDTFLLIDRGIPRDSIVHYVRHDIPVTRYYNAQTPFPTAYRPITGDHKQIPQTPASSYKQNYALQHERFANDQLAQSAANTDATPSSVARGWEVLTPVTAVDKPQLPKFVDSSVYQQQEVQKGSVAGNLAQLLNAEHTNPSAVLNHLQPVAPEATTMQSYGLQGGSQHDDSSDTLVYDRKDLISLANAGTQQVVVNPGVMQGESATPAGGMFPTPTVPSRIEPAAKPKKTRAPRKKKQ